MSAAPNAASAITAVTVQDTLGVHAIHPIPPPIIAAQIRVVLADIGADAIKTGMLGGGGGNLVFNRFTGPGRVGLQSAYFHPPVAEGPGQANADQGLGGMIGNFLGN